MGSVLHSLGRQEEALEHYQRALATYQQLYPPKQYPQGHTFLALTLRNRGGALLAVQRYEEASVVLEKALVMQRGLADRLAMASSESEALAFNRAVLSSLHFYLSATAHLPQSAPATYARTWIDRAPLNRILLQRHQAALAAASDNPEIRKLFDQLQTTRRDLARLLLQSLPTAPEALQTRDRRVNELTEAKQQQERALVRLLPDLDQQRRLDTRGPEDLRKALPADAVFLDVLRYIRNEYDPRKPGEAGRKAIPHFVAFVVRADAEVQRVELGEAKLIEAMVADYLHLIEQRRDQESPEAAATLRRLVWEPIAAHLPRETHTVYLTPDGDLTRLPWAALPGSKKDTILLEDHALALVPHGPYLLEHLRSERRFGQGKAPPLVLGGVRYSDIPPLLSNALAQRGPGRDGAVENWAYLDGTEREVKLLQKWGGKDTLALEGKDASVPRLLSALPQARLAHLATHGFFNQKEYRLERKRARKQASDLLRSQDLMLDQQQGRRITAGAQTPLAYTGLVLAGANVPDKAGPYGGILTGEAIVDLDLRNLELAMLSACQTGLGEVENGECVHNLQIAFHVAGCANVAATLWNVPDESTAALMGLFYRELLDGGKTPLEALRSAQLYLYRHPGQIKDLAERGPPLVAKGAKLPEPEVKTGIQVPAEGKRAAVKDWAAFVLSGVGR
jgi:CHAT domain-containing protein